MSHHLMLPAPKKRRRKKVKNALVSVLFTVFLSSAIFITFTTHQKELLANLTYSDLQIGIAEASEGPPPAQISATKPQQKIRSKDLAGTVQETESLLAEKNRSSIEIVTVHQGKPHRRKRQVKTTLTELGFEYTLDKTLKDGALQLAEVQPFHNTLAAAESNLLEFVRKSTVAQLTLDTSKWESFLVGLAERVEKPAREQGLNWTEDDGWTLVSEKNGVTLDLEHAQELFVQLRSDLSNSKEAPQALELHTLPTDPTLSRKDKRQMKRLFRKIQKLVAEPILLNIDGEEKALDLNSAEDFVSIDGLQVEVNLKSVKRWVRALAKEVETLPSRVIIVDKEEIRPDVFKAVTEGTFSEGSRIDIDEVYDAILASLSPEEASAEESTEETADNEEGESKKSIDVTLYEVPVKVYNKLEEKPYELIAVGYSDYSEGNKPNRVHNIETGIKRINHSLVDAGAEISFNKLNGIIDDEFKEGYAIFGKIARKNLGGGICQVSTTFYRALLNLGVPITMRKNHSWDLSYYRSGGYGLDATIYPSQGLDVKGVNDYDGSLYVYSYTRPETEEAFILFYGEGDGREVTLTPDKDYQFFYGPKTLKWTQTVAMPDGELRESRIVSHYKK